MTHLGSTPWRPVRTRLLLALLLGLSGLTWACIVTDKGLPCRRDCQCPSGQFCSGNSCAAGSPASKSDGDEGGKCNPNGGCNNSSLVCHPDGCGGSVCRVRCDRRLLNSGCTGGTTCEDIRTGQLDGGGGNLPDGGLAPTEGVCVP